MRAHVSGTPPQQHFRQPATLVLRPVRQACAFIDGAGKEHTWHAASNARACLERTPTAALVPASTQVVRAVCQARACIDEQPNCSLSAPSMRTRVWHTRTATSAPSTQIVRAVRQAHVCIDAPGREHPKRAHQCTRVSGTHSHSSIGSATRVVRAVWQAHAKDIKTHAARETTTHRHDR